jgi:hypothetical protein
MHQRRSPSSVIPRVPILSGRDAKADYARHFPVQVGVDTGKTFHQLVARGHGGKRLAKSGATPADGPCGRSDRGEQQ